MTTIYPIDHATRDRWILKHRPQRNVLDPSRPYDFFVEEECSSSGELEPIATIFLTNRECPWRCVMCDLWQNTTRESVAAGAIPAQIEYALRLLPAARQIKLYNSGSFFDVRAIARQDYPKIADLTSSFERVIVESHPALVGDACLRFKDLVRSSLEVAMGLETVHPETLERLNKQMTLEQFSTAAKRLRKHNIDLRVFILVKPPFMQEEEAIEWAARSLDFAFDSGATAATLIPTRSGNGALEELALTGDFTPPRLATTEAVAAYGISLARGRVFVDLWNLDKNVQCFACHSHRIERLRRMNLAQLILEPISCDICGGKS